MFAPVLTSDPTAVEAEVLAAYRSMFPAGDPAFVPKVFGWAVKCFEGEYADYQAVDARYHDLEHTLQGTLCMARLLQRRQVLGGRPALTQQMFELGLLAILLHDTGYLKKRGDTEGTGAKYTAVHVNRSVEFAAQLLGENSFSADEIKSVQHMIRCTGVDAILSVIPFQSELERIVGFALGTADLLGQMAADDYVDELPILFLEFAEAVKFYGSMTSFVATFSSAHDLMHKTPAFWEKFVKLKLNRDFGGLYRFLNNPYPHGPNYYMERIEGNILRLKKHLASLAAQ